MKIRVPARLRKVIIAMSEQKDKNHDEKSTFHTDPKLSNAMQGTYN